ncbi:hypothetical protein G7054_g1812 [Neopestalotiopsis clavispora]|nr:hypothetical protein G7054_g1812 [Neopestalotiopsis clavispora]
MPGIRSSSDSSGGAMLARALEATPNKDHDGMGSTTNRSDSPSDDEMALVEASDQFNKLVNDSQGYRPLVAADEYHQGHHLRRPSTVRPPNGFVGQQPFGSPGSNVPPSVASSPLYRGFGDIQARLVTAQQYVRVTPGYNNDQAQNIQTLLIGVGQDLTHFATNIIQEHTKSQHQVGELRMQYEKAQTELLSRRQQIADLQTKYRELSQDKDQHAKIATGLEKQVESQQKDIQRLQKLAQNFEQKRVKQVKELETEIKSLRLERDNKMQLVKVSKTANDENDSDNEDVETPTNNNRGPPTKRRESFLNPNASEFGPRGAKADHSKEMLPLLRKYATEGATMATTTQTQDARSYTPGNFEPPKPAPSRMGFRSGTPATPFGLTNTFGAKSNALVRTNTPRQTGFRAVTEFGSVDFNALQNKPAWEAEDVAHGFARLFGLIEGLIAKNHITPPFNEADSMLVHTNPATWNYILSMGLKNPTHSASHMADLLTKFKCRHWVMKRILVDYIINRLIVPEIFFGFNDAIDSHLSALQSRMRSRGPNAGRPQGAERQRIVMDHAKVVQFIIESGAEADEFRDRSVAKHVGMLMEILKPMRSCSIDDETARRALTVVINAAWTITTHVWTSGMTLHYYFPETGSKFAYGTMRSINYTDTPSDQMQYQQYRIMLVVTPTLSLRDDRDMDRLRTHELLKSDVLVMR